MTDESASGAWSFSLYVSGASPRSAAAISTIRRLCSEDLHGDAILEIIDVYTQPALAVRDDVIATPTLVRRLPLPIHRLIGDLSDLARIRMSLGLVRPGTGTGL